MPPRKTAERWLEDHLRDLCAWGDAASNIRPEVRHEYGLHTAFKLCGLKHVMDVFTVVAAARVKSGEFGGMVYLDLFSGCGVNRLPETGDWLAGSPLIAANAKRPFDQIVGVESKKKNRHALLKRLGSAVAKTTITQGDCNEVTEEIIDSVTYRKPLVLAFVDPEGMETYWETLERLSDTFEYMDLVINLTAGTKREMGALMKTAKNADNIDRFTGLELHELFGGYGGDIDVAYKDRVRFVLGKSRFSSIPIGDSRGQLAYHLLISTRLTAGGSRFADAYGGVADRISRLTVRHVEGALNRIKRRDIDSALERHV